MGGVDYVNWNMDFYLTDIFERNDLNEGVVREALIARNNLYRFLSLKSVLSRCSPQLKKGNIPVYKRKKGLIMNQHQKEDSRIGPYHDGILYYFGKDSKLIALDYLKVFNKKNPDFEGFVPYDAEVL